MPKYNPAATASFTGITLSHTRAHFARAIMEAVAYTLKQNLDYVGAEKVDEIRITGGGASSPLWAQIKADVTGRTLQGLAEGETACLGCAIFAAVGVGLYPSIADAARTVVKTKGTYAPSGADYSKSFDKYQQIDHILN